MSAFVQIFVVVALVMVARVAVSPIIFARLANRFVRTFKLVIADEATVLVAKVPVPFTITFPATKALPKLLEPLKVVEPNVVVAAVTVASAVVPVAVKFVVAKFEVVAFVPVAFVKFKFNTESAFANKVFRTFNQVIDEDATVLVANEDVPPAVIFPLTASVPIFALLIVEEDIVEVPIVVVASAVVPVAVKFVVAKFEVVAYVTVAFVAEKLNTFKIFAQRVARTFKFVAVPVAIVVVARVVVPELLNVPVEVE